MSNLSGFNLTEGEEARSVALPSQTVAPVTMPSAQPALSDCSRPIADAESVLPKTYIKPDSTSTVHTAATFTVFGVNSIINPTASLSDLLPVPPLNQPEVTGSTRQRPLKAPKPSRRTQSLPTHPEALQSDTNALVQRSTQPVSRKDSVCQVFTIEDIKTMVEHACKAALPREALDRSVYHYYDCIDNKNLARENNKAVPGVLVFAQTYVLSIVDSVEAALEYQWLGSVMEKLASADALQAYAQELQDTIGGGFVRSEGSTSVIKRSIKRRIDGHFCENGYQKGKDDLNRIFLAVKKFIRDKLMPSLFSSHGFIVDDHLIPQFKRQLKEALVSLKLVLHDVMQDHQGFEAAYLANMGVAILPRIDVEARLEKDLRRYLVR